MGKIVTGFLLITAKTERNTPEKKEGHPKGKKRVKLNCIRTEVITNSIYVMFDRNNCLTQAKMFRINGKM